MRNVSEIYRSIQNEYKDLTTYEKLNLAIQWQRNEILQSGLVVSQKDGNPTALEAISLELGYGQNTGLLAELGEIVRTLDEIKGRIEK